MEIKELELAETAGAEVLDMTCQKRERPDPALFIGKGKVQQLNLLKQEKGANLIIFDDELSRLSFLLRNVSHYMFAYTSV